MRTKKQFEAVPDVRTLERLSDGTRLEWVPSWEGALQWAPQDLKEDRPLRLWHTFHSKHFGGRRVRIQLRPHLPVYQGSHSLRPRADFIFKHKGQKIHIYRSHLTMLCITGFTIADRRHWVIDHIDGNTLNDRPSNLQVITQRENLQRSERYRQTRSLSPKEKKRQCDEHIAWMKERRRQLIAIHKDADPNDIEFELALEMQERFKN